MWWERGTPRLRKPRKNGRRLASREAGQYISSMPSQIAHILLGREARSVLPAGWSAQFSDPAFRLGCQGPDLFYHSRRAKPGAFLYGTRLHRRSWGEFLSRFRREGLRPVLGARASGDGLSSGAVHPRFLDRQAHPFIVFFFRMEDPREPAHRFASPFARVLGTHPRRSVVGGTDGHAVR